MPPLINPKLCTLCGICAEVCPGDILYIDQGVAGFVRFPSECSHCDVCRAECPEGAIDMKFTWNMLQRPVVLKINETVKSTKP
jgi:adenylylsulfate reductase subunit B